MDFLVVKDPEQYAPGTIYRSIELTIKDEQNVLFQSKVTGVHDQVDTWLAVLQFLFTTNQHDEENHLEIDKLLDTMPELFRATVLSAACDTYFNLLHALFLWLPYVRDVNDQNQKWYALYKSINLLLSCVFSTSNPIEENYEATFSGDSSQRLRVTIPCKKFDISPLQVSQAILASVYEKRKDDALYFIDNYHYFQLNVTRLSREREEQRTVETFKNLSKALIVLIKQGPADLGIYESLIPDICTFIVKHETDIEEQKRYLEYILESQENEGLKKQRLDEIIDTCRTQQTTDPARLIQLISIISDHYLRLYNFKQSTYFWERAKTKDRVLTFFLSFHKHPMCYLLSEVGILILLFAIVWLPSVFHWQIPTPLTQGVLPAILSWIPPVLLLAAVGFVVLSAALKSKRWLYSQLLFPRIVGAAIVGMFPLLFSSQSWLVGLQSRPVPWLLLFLFTYISSFLYMFIEVYQTMKFVKGRTLEEALKTSVKIFCIAACETLIIITVTSMFVFPSIVQSLVNSNADASANAAFANAPGIPVNLPPLLSFNIFPFLILLWGGFALFIGSFVQLLWQDRRITDPI